MFNPTRHMASRWYNSDLHGIQDTCVRGFFWRRELTACFTSASTAHRSPYNVLMKSSDKLEISGRNRAVRRLFGSLRHKLRVHSARIVRVWPGGVDQPLDVNGLRGLRLSRLRSPRVTNRITGRRRPNSLLL
jgi:hypothetical protein